METLDVISKNSNSTEENIISVKNREEEGNDKQKKYFLALNWLSPILMILIGIIVLKVTGLYDSMNSTAGKFTLCAVVSFSYLIAFRRGLNSK